MKRRLMSLVLWTVLLATPIFAFAKEDEDSSKFEGRLEGFPAAVRLEKNSTTLTWVFLFFLTACSVAVLLKNAKRTHLD